MMIKIRDNPVVTGGSKSAQRYREAIQSIAGKWVEVETKWLFQTQFNISNPDLRIYARDVVDIERDIRLTVIYDEYTYKSYADIADLPSECLNTRERRQYIVKFVQVRGGDKIALGTIPVFKN